MSQMRNLCRGAAPWVLASVAGVLTVGQIALAFLYAQGEISALRTAGWGILGLSALFGWAPILLLRLKGGVEKGRSYVHTTELVTSGLYAVVRHPQSGLAWLLLNLSFAMISQRALPIALGGLSMSLAYADLVRADRDNIEKFGEAYERYMQDVPRVNIILGMLRLFRRRARK